MLLLLNIGTIPVADAIPHSTTGTAVFTYLRQEPHQKRLTAIQLFFICNCSGYEFDSTAKYAKHAKWIDFRLFRVFRG
jgi:hypothetical protein